MLPFVRLARAHALVAASAMALAGAVAGAVRVLPWLLDPHVPLHIVAPFARGLLAVALEAALLVGWPVGWALACFRLVESGEALTLQTLGESPATTMKRLAPQGAALALMLALVALIWGSDANAPGRVATELVVGARASCVKATEPMTYVVPFTELTWLCAPDREPRLAGVVPGALEGVVMTARGARIAGDFRAIELDDAYVAVPREPPVLMHAGTLSMHGMAPWAHASTLPPLLRALVLALSAWVAATIAGHRVLTGAAIARVGAIVLGAAGPVAALASLRALERADSRPAAFVLVPMVACVAAAAAGELLPRLRALRTAGRWAELARRKSRC
ncbi:MAG: hypothetical protein M3O46_08630 [Myxococcota bacterium]|nr:hypothetical protein [Myxococcota bacterium]